MPVPPCNVTVRRQLLVYTMSPRLLRGPLLLFLWQAAPVGVQADSAGRYRLTMGGARGSGSNAACRGSGRAGARGRRADGRGLTTHAKLVKPMVPGFRCKALLLVTAALGTACGSSQGEKRARTGQAAASDTSAIYQLVIDLPELGQYYHAEMPGRTPLVVLRNSLTESQPPLRKFGAPVTFMSASALGPETPFLELTRLEIVGDSARVAFEYPIEGIRGLVALVRDGGAWKVAAKELVERR